MNSATSNAKKALATSVMPIPMEVTLTAYVPKPGSKTSTGRDANSRPGIAAHWDVFPPGTKVTIPKIGTFVVDDKIPSPESETRKYAVTKNDLRSGKRIHIDFRIPPKHREGADPRIAFQNAVDMANRIGRRKVDVYIVIPKAHQRNG